MADVASTLRSWSSTASSNQPQGSTTIGSGLDDNLRQIQATVRQYMASQSATVVPSAGIADLTTATGFWVPVSGNSTVTGFGSESAGIWYGVVLTGSPTINNGNISTPGGVTIAGSAGDQFIAVSQGSSVWSLIAYSRVSGAPVNMSPQNTVLGGDVSINSSSSFVDGITLNVGTSGRWLVFGKACVTDTTGIANLNVKLWDGTTVIDSAAGVNVNTGNATPFSLCGVINNPAAALRISAQDTASVHGVIKASASGVGFDTTITAIRIG